MSNRKTQRGAILVTSLLILIVLTIVGVTAMQMTRMQERMAGNSRDISLAFQGSEAALRDAERIVRDYVAEPAKCSNASATCTTVYAREILPNLADQPKTWWNNTAREYGDAGTHELTDEGLIEDPKYATEELLHVRNCLVMDADCGRRTIYQVTARSTGASGEADVVLQTTYAKPPY
jgi:type IV pilus assembly protein PilX